MLDFYGLDLGLRVSRKHLGWYMDYAKTDPLLRKRILTCLDPKELYVLLADALICDDKEVAA